MSRPIPARLYSHRFDEDTPDSEALVSHQLRANPHDELHQVDSAQANATIDCSSHAPELRKLDEASVDACFSRLSDLLADCC